MGTDSVVEKANHVAAQSFWRTPADYATVEAAQSGLDTWCAHERVCLFKALDQDQAALAADVSGLLRFMSLQGDGSARAWACCGSR